MKRILAVAMMGILAGPAYAQMGMSGGHKTPLQLQYEREDQERKESERAYEQQMKRLKAQPPAGGPRDPWAGVRPAPEPNKR